MDLRRFVKLRRGFAGIALCSALALTVVTGASSSERMVTKAFDHALADRDFGDRATMAAVPAAQTEEFWLRGERPATIKPVAWTGALSRGDRITISAGDDARVLEVVDTHALSGATRLDVAINGTAALRLVVCRDVGHPDKPLVRFVVSEGATLPFNMIRAERAL